MKEPASDGRATDRGARGRRTHGAPRAAGIGALGLALALGGCASMSKKDCLAGDWYQRGYRDASAGDTFDRLDAHVKACAKVGAVPDEAVYGTGYEAGLVDYCTPDRGYELGRRDTDYRGICPFDVEAAFLGGYVGGLESALVSREGDAIRAESTFEHAVAARASVPRGASVKKAQGALDSARYELDRLRGERLGLLEKIRRWNAERAAL